MSEKYNIVDSVIPENFEIDARKWLRIIRYHEPATIISFQQDAFYRTSQIINNRKVLKRFLGKYYLKYLLVYVQYEGGELFNQIKEKILELCRKRKINLKPEDSLEQLLATLENKGYDVGIFLSHIDDLLKDEKTLQKMNELFLGKHGNVSVLMFFTQNVTYQSYSQLVRSCPFLFINVTIYPLYSEDDSLNFLEKNCRLWDIKLSKEDKQAIIKQSGGYYWLLRSILRYLRDNPRLPLANIFEDKLLIAKLEVLWNRLTEKERLLLMKVNNGALSKIDQDTEEYKYLINARLLLESKDGISLGIPLFASMISKDIESSKIHIVNEDIFVNNKSVTYDLSKNELIILRLLIAKKNKLVDRQEIAEKIWGNKWEDKYSDWAIDRLIYRVRSKLKDFGMDDKLIRTLKTRGFIFG